MSSAKIVANSRIIYNEVRNQLTSGQIANWRISTYESDLTQNQKFTLNDLKSLMDLDNDYMPEMIIKNIFDKLSRGEIDQDNLWFIMIDSCIMCTQSIETIIKNIRNQLSNNAYIVLIKNNISTIENNFKIANQNNNKYNNIDFTLLKQNIAYLEGKYLDGDSYMHDESSYDDVITTNIYHENEILTKIENKILKSNNNRWNPLFRNESNDDAQLLLLEDYMSYVQDSNGIFITKDKLYIEGCKGPNGTPIILLPFKIITPFASSTVI
jgi:hypothetical protein